MDHCSNVVTVPAPDHALASWMLIKSFTQATSIKHGFQNFDASWSLGTGWECRCGTAVIPRVKARPDVHFSCKVSTPDSGTDVDVS